MSDYQIVWQRGSGFDSGLTRVAGACRLWILRGHASVLGNGAFHSAPGDRHVLSYRSHRNRNCEVRRTYLLALWTNAITLRCPAYEKLKRLHVNNVICR